MEQHYDLMTLVMEAAAETGFVSKDEHGEVIGTGREGVKGYLKWAALHKAERFLALMARVAPKHVFADVTHHNGALTDAEIEAELKDRGLPLDLLPLLMNVPEDNELDFDENPDPYNTMKDVTPKTNGTGDDTAG